MADVTRADQDLINLFSRLNTRRHDVQAQIKAKKAAAEDIEEAGNECMLVDDSTIPFVVGECFVHLPGDEVEQRLQSLLEETRCDIDRLEGDLKDTQLEMASLKSTLYAKFGDSINLEE